MLSDYRNIHIPSTYINSNSPIVQLIDAGHGGIINGSYITAPDKMFKYKDFIFYEGVVNRKIAKAIARHMYINKLSYSIINDTEDDWYLSKRAKVANDFQEKHPELACYYHSVHCNAFKDNSVDGYQVHIHPLSSTESLLITIEMLKAQKDIIGMDDRGMFESTYTVLSKTNMPAVLSENGFFTNEKRAKWLLNKNNQDKLGRFYMQVHKRIIKEDILHV